jgi:hypothetical protein
MVPPARKAREDAAVAARGTDEVVTAVLEDLLRNPRLNTKALPTS